MDFRKDPEKHSKKLPSFRVESIDKLVIAVFMVNLVPEDFAEAPETGGDPPRIVWLGVFLNAVFLSEACFKPEKGGTKTMRRNGSKR